MYLRNTMKLNHLNLPVANVPTAREFFQTYFGFESVDAKLNETLSVMQNDDRFTLVLMNNNLNENGNSTYPDAFHFGFFLDDEEQVNAMYNRLKDGGVELPQEPQRVRRTYGFYFKHQAVLIEVAVMS